MNGLPHIDIAFANEHNLLPILPNMTDPMTPMFDDSQNHQFFGIGDECKGKRRRLTPVETRTLMAVFQTNPRPNSMVRARLAQDLGISVRTIQIWFQNRRAKLRREKTTGAQMINQSQYDPVLPLPNGANFPMLNHSTHYMAENPMPEIAAFESLLPEPKVAAKQPIQLLSPMSDENTLPAAQSNATEVFVEKLSLAQPWDMSKGLFHEEIFGLPVGEGLFTESSGSFETF